MHIRIGAWFAFVIIGITAVACSNSTTVLPTPTAQQNIPTQAPTQTPPTPVSAPTPTPALVIADSGETLLAETDFTHDGFRTQVERQLEVTDLPSTNSPSNLVVKLENLSASSGSLNTRATLNFDRGFDNYIEVPTENGPLKLHLHRDGTLAPEADNGPFTWPDILPGGAALTFSTTLDENVKLISGSYAFNINIATVAPNPIRVSIALEP